MDNKLDVLEDFANVYSQEAIDGLSTELIVAIVSKIGGEDKFLDIYEDVFYRGAVEYVDSFNDEDECLSFYMENQTDLLRYLEAVCQELSLTNVSLSMGLLVNEDKSLTTITQNDINLLLSGDIQKIKTKNIKPFMRFYKILLLHVVELISDEYLQYEDDSRYW